VQPDVCSHSPLPVTRRRKGKFLWVGAKELFMYRATKNKLSVHSAWSSWRLLLGSNGRHSRGLLLRLGLLLGGVARIPMYAAIPVCRFWLPCEPTSATLRLSLTWNSQAGFQRAWQCVRMVQWAVWYSFGCIWESSWFVADCFTEVEILDQRGHTLHVLGRHGHFICKHGR